MLKDIVRVFLTTLFTQMAQALGELLGEKLKELWHYFFGPEDDSATPEETSEITLESNQGELDLEK